ncbi:MAG TPA: hypothetical protein VGH74_07620 [Planctomycetaceae bacterium]|jgi:hypothetical protein
MLGNVNLLEIAEIRKIDNGHAAGTTTITPTSIDMSGFDAIAVVVDLGAVTDGSVMDLKLQSGAASNGSDAADMKDAAGNVLHAGLTGATSSNAMIAVDATRPNQRYVTAVFARGTQNAVINTMIAILYRFRNSAPVAQGATVLASKIAPVAGN